MPTYRVAVLNTVHDFFDYKAVNLTPTIGARVWVPFRNKKMLGIVVGIGNSDKDIKLKEITTLIDKNPLLTEDILSLAHWISNYYQAPLPAVLALVLPKKYRLGEEESLATISFYSLKLNVTDALQLITKRSKKQRDLINFLDKLQRAISKKELLANNFNLAEINKLLEKGILATHNELDKPKISFKKKSVALELNVEQKKAFNIIVSALSSYHCFLLQGVTGSGKTEVYLQVIDKVLNNKRQVLIIVPEIGLTPQLLERFSSRFEETMLVIHSNLNDTERQQAWQLALKKEVQIIIGTRTALFTPMPNLGLIIIDEEHDLSLKQKDGVRYFARDTALMRAYKAQIPVILGSATPSLESLYNCKLKKYTLLQLKQKALDSKPLNYQLIDIRNKKLQDGLAKETIDLINEHLNLDNQALIFINRRGFSPVLLCHDCGFVSHCNACDTNLTLHKSINKLICHHCGLTKTKPTCCEKCKSLNLIPIGIGTQRIYESLSILFPTTSILRIDRDATTKKNAINNYLESIHSGDVQLIIGTQMLAKGHHFPRLTLVVVLDADSGFYNQDFRALERFGQLLTQVSGRAGRAENPGQVVIQTTLPNDPVFNLLFKEGYTAFANFLLSAREKASLPPYTKIAILRAESKKEANVLAFMHKAKEQLIKTDIEVLGPAPAPLAKKSGQYRMQLMLKSFSRKKLNTALVQLRSFFTTNRAPASLRWSIDVDPQDFA